MKNAKRDAIVEALTTAGWGSVIMTDWERDGDLAINCEEWVDGKGMAGDYYAMNSEVYDEFGTNKEINEIVESYGCYAEWYHGGTILISE